MIVLERQQIMSMMLPCCPSNLLLTTHGIGSNDGSSRIDHLQQVGHHRDLVGLVRHLLLRQDDLELARPDTDGVQGGQASLSRSSSGLAIHGKHLVFFILGQVGQDQRPAPL